MTEICSIIHKCTIHGEKNYMNLNFSSPLNTIFLTLNLISEFFYLLKFLISKVINIHEKNGTREKVRIIEKSG